MPRIGLALAVFVAAGLTGCLGYGDKDTATEVIKTVYTRGDPADCTDRETQRLVEQTTFYRGTGAQLVCRSNEANLEPADTVSISNVKVHGDTAVARVAIRGGAADGQRQTLRLVKQSGGWKIDEITALHIDRARWERALRRALTGSASGMTAKQVACYLRALQPASDSAIERAVVHSDASVFAAPLKKCVSVKAPSTSQ
ncbi:MAG: hypothetical protein QOI98_626 [Solirubrobacteraceae bacterium]|nr:hypothetical protein [Solirubrobacteraceae bacterium]